MRKRIIVSTVVTLALAFAPSLAFSLPTKSVHKKKASSANSQREDSKKSRNSNKSRYSHRHYREDSGEAVESSMVPQASARSYESTPLMKVTPQRDGGFLLEPLEPKKTGAALNKPSSNAEVDRDQSSLRQGEHHYNRFTPWDFSDLVLAEAEQYRNFPYARGCSFQNSNATDCSGFVQYIYHGFKINLPRSSAEQAEVGKVVTRDMDFSKLLPGDLLFFRRDGHVGHAGIYLGDGKMIHASNPRNGVTVTDLREQYYQDTFVVAKRVFEVQYPKY
ncbi:MAG: NlpC/P60 family protein [Desulfobaccales bacterium]